jgi:hypothetical protein
MSANPQPMLKMGDKLVARASLPCPKCKMFIEINVSMTVENTAPVSMILWTHEEPFECMHCHLLVMPVITAILPSAIQWNIAPIRNQEKQLIEAPGQIDISNLRLRN